MGSSIQKRLTVLLEHFWTYFGSTEGVRVFQAPGRVNLIGDHTDYNLGFVLPVAINRQVIAMARARNDRLVRLRSRQFQEPVEFSLDGITAEKGSWGNYPKGVARVMEQAGHRLRGLEAVLDSTIPPGAGLSSSAALELASAMMFTSLSGIDLDRVEMAKLCRRAEHEFAGVECGIMDQLVSALGEEGNALFLDCRDLSRRMIPVPLRERKLIVADTKVKRSLASSEYNRRKSECTDGLRILKQKLPDIESLRDVVLKQVEECKGALPVNIWKRCLHVVSENRRVEKAVKALERREMNEFGNLMRGSHYSLKELYQASSRELDILVQAAHRIPGVLGSRMTGAGFGGCTVTLVNEHAVAKFRDDVARAYRNAVGTDPDFYDVTISGGAGEIPLEKPEN